jgi:hypothetical protein
VGNSKRHHFVPRSYLERFGVDGTVLVRHRDGKIYASDPTNVAVEAGFYDVPIPGAGVSKAVERLLSLIDGEAIDAIRAIDDSARPPPRGSEPRIAVAVFMALQMARTPEARERVLFPRRVHDYAAGRDVTVELVTQYLRDVHLGFEPSEREARAAWDLATFVLREAPEVPTPAFAMETMLGSVDEVAPRLDAMNWTLEIDRKGRLITSDVPVVVWKRPSHRDRFMGYGVENADEIRFALGPHALLTLTRASTAETARIGGERLRACNEETAAACYRFVVGRSDRREAIVRIPLGDHRPVLRFNIAPGYEVLPDGSQRRMEGEILHTWIPRR